MSRQTPAAFLSYARFDDEHCSGCISTLRRLLADEVRCQTGEEFLIFQDRTDIEWGRAWNARIREAIQTTTFFIPVITPSFFKSDKCKEELREFLERMQHHRDSSVLLPIYFVQYEPQGSEEEANLAEILNQYQYADFRYLRYEPFDGRAVKIQMGKMARRIRDALFKIEAEADKSVGGEATLPERGPAPRNEPRIRVVPDDFPTITAAIQVASAGDRLLIRPGTYREELIIDKPLELVGEGAPAETTIEAVERPAILFATTLGRIAGLSLCQLSGDSFCVEIAQGRPDIEDCDITSESLACLAIHGGADPRVRHNKIHDGKDAGVLFYGNARGSLEENDIVANGRVGIAIEGGSFTVLRRNTIIRGDRGGLLIHESSKAIVEDNEISGNAYSGVAIKDGGYGIVRWNRIKRNGHHGVWVHDGGAGEFKANDFSGNLRGDWWVAPGAATGVERFEDGGS